MREADEVSMEDLEAAAEFFDGLDISSAETRPHIQKFHEITLGTVFRFVGQNDLWLKIENNHAASRKAGGLGCKFVGNNVEIVATGEWLNLNPYDV